MATFHFDLVSPEKLAFSGEVDQVDVPGVEGDFGVLAGHAPVVAAIRPGILTITTGGTHQKIIVLGGLAEVSEKGLTVLADVATSIAGTRPRAVRRNHLRDGSQARREGRLRARSRDRAARPLQEHPARAQHDGDALSPGAIAPGRIEGPNKFSARHIVTGADFIWRFRFANRLPTAPGTAMVAPGTFWRHSAGADCCPGLPFMKRKIAAIFAADIAGYSRLVAEDEEETLRRLASYRQVTDDFIAKCGGRIFNTAGDAVLAEFPSAVEAVRCAIDIQESLRTRNMAYPPSRQMAFRIGITIGDVVERDGDLLGDGVNIAARLEGLAEVGGICVSRAVHEQVANKLSVQFADIGAQEVKNIPTPVHAYMVAMRREDGTYSTPQVKKPVKAAGAPNWMWPVAVTLVCLAAIGVGGFLYFTKLETQVAKVAARRYAVSPAPRLRPRRHR